MTSSMVRASSTVLVSPMRAFHKALFLPAGAALLVFAGLIFWQTVAAAPALSYGGPGQVHFKDSTVTAGSEPLLCFDAVEWKRLCPGTMFARLTPANVSDRSARTVDLDPHTISTPLAIGKLGPKCRTAKVPAGLSPGVWRMVSHVSNVCALPLLGNVTVTTSLPDALVTIKAP